MEGRFALQFLPASSFLLACECGFLTPGWPDQGWMCWVISFQCRAESAECLNPSGDFKQSLGLSAWLNQRLWQAGTLGWTQPCWTREVSRPGVKWDLPRCVSITACPGGRAAFVSTAGPEEAAECTSVSIPLAVNTPQPAWPTLQAYSCPLGPVRAAKASGAAPEEHGALRIHSSTCT